MKNWFYESNGDVKGPVSQVELLRLMLSGKIHPQTLVWTASFGERWKTVEQAGLTRLAARIGQLGRFGRPVSGVKLQLGEIPLDPNAPKKPVPFTWAWILLLLPSTLSIIIEAFTNVTTQPSSEHSIVTFLLCMIFFLSLTMDRTALREAGYKAPSFWWWLFLPGYFIERLRYTRKGATLMVLSLLFATVAVLQVVWHPDYTKVNELITKVTHSKVIQLPIHEAPIEVDENGDLNV